MLVRAFLILSDSSETIPSLHSSLMQRMTQVLSRMLNDPATRAAFNNPPLEAEENESLNLNQSETAEVSSSETPYSSMKPSNAKKVHHNGDGSSDEVDDDVPVLTLPFVQKFTGHRNVRYNIYKFYKNVMVKKK